MARMFLGLAGFLLSGTVLWAAEPTAFALIKEGNRYVGEQARDKVVQIRSEKSIGGLVPAVWRVVYYDSTATLNAVEVKFGAGKMMDVKRPFRLLEPIRGRDKPLDREKLKIDSDQAIKLATSEPLLARIHLMATSARLEHGAGESADPVWRIRVWASKIRHPDDQVDLGEVVLSAKDGAVLKNDLHINRVD